MPDQLLVAARAELPLEALNLMEALVPTLLERFDLRHQRMPLEIELYEDKV
jgi:hypothetical protein